VAQVVGGVVAALALKALVTPELFAAARGGGQWIASDVTMSHAIGLEAIATFFLVFVVFGTAVNPEGPKLGGMAIGLTIAADILAIGPLTGASMNPARSFGPALAVGNWEGQVVFWVGPIIGALLAALVWEFVFFRGAARQH
jgi:glycerol uptake facilitator-like aquaporin